MCVALITLPKFHSIKLFPNYSQNHGITSFVFYFCFIFFTVRKLTRYDFNSLKLLTLVFKNTDYIVSWLILRGYVIPLT